ncbi:glycosyltransferase 87 family protein [Mycolicibacterium rhodesiae]|uniref:glycosyltransferase 87 family protein n=1 Tax=Mycolicibacterium rhodesiae TaxID=36814 RepID=UPI0013FE17DC|nr:glycosyltransferase 87 family protein [Mycolicibacterium rhodesiae]MCV7347646.1 DUF2029 domain-containing protein [Mycolicibacterium rhodesiae]
MGYVLMQYFAVDVPSSIISGIPEDCYIGGAVSIGRHCFTDHATASLVGMQPNPFDYQYFLPQLDRPATGNYPAAAYIPHLVFELPARWLGVPAVGLVGYLIALTIAVMSAAIWAARTARGLDWAVIIVALGAAAIPAWAAVDTGNSAGFLVPIGLVFLVALRRQRWALVAVMVILATLVKPQFVVLGVVLLAARQWKWSGIAFGGAAAASIAAFALWPRDFPRTIVQSIDGLIGYGNQGGGPQNASFGTFFQLIAVSVKFFHTGVVPDDRYFSGVRSLIAYGTLVVIVAAVLVVGRRIPPVMAGVVLLPTAALFPPAVNIYYLVFVLPIAAIVVRDPDGPPGSGIFDQFAAGGDRRRAPGICVSLAVAFSIAHLPLAISRPAEFPIYAQFGARGITGYTPMVGTTMVFMGFWWLVTCIVILASYARRAGQVTAGAETFDSPP